MMYVAFLLIPANEVVYPHRIAYIHKCGMRLEVVLGARVLEAWGMGSLFLGIRTP